VDEQEYPEMLTRFGPESVNDGAVTVIVSGALPSREAMQQRPIRYAALDGGLDDVGLVTDQTIMPLISEKWADAKKVDWRAKVQTAHANGQRVRFWGTPDKKQAKRVAVWQQLLAGGCPKSRRTLNGGPSRPVRSCWERSGR
jgi:hypothetical protein